jgi:siroheme synthase
MMKVLRNNLGLLTLNAVRLLQNAHAMYFDTHVNMVMLDHAQRVAGRKKLRANLKEGQLQSMSLATGASI